MIRTSWVDPATNKEYSYTWGFDIRDELTRMPIIYKGEDEKMTMNNMVKRFEAAGFKTEKRYLSDKELYKFTIAKNGYSVFGYFKYDNSISPAARDKGQSEFISSLIAGFKRSHNSETNSIVPTIKAAHFNDPVTVVIWTDGTKTIVRCQEGDVFDPEKGLAMAIAKKALGNKGNFNDVFKKWIIPYWEHQLIRDDNERRTDS